MLILSSTEVLLDCFHFLAVVNLAAVNTCGQVSVWT